MFSENNYPLVCKINFSSENLDDQVTKSSQSEMADIERSGF